MQIKKAQKDDKAVNTQRRDKPKSRHQEKTKKREKRMTRISLRNSNDEIIYNK